jgi:hypothetical protein
MEKTLREHFLDQVNEIIAYLPSLLAGLALLLVGWLLGWIAKRVTMQLAYLLRLDRFLVGFRWGKDFARADVRYGFYNFLGNIVFLIVILVFLDSALNAWKLTALSTMLGDSIVLLPRLLIALLVFGIGWLIANSASRALYRGFKREKLPRAMLLSRFAKVILILLFSAMALVELAIAREIVVIGFATVFITLGLVVVALAFVGGKEFIKDIRSALDDEEKPESASRES